MCVCMYERIFVRTCECARSIEREQKWTVVMPATRLDHQHQRVAAMMNDLYRYQCWNDYTIDERASERANEREKERR